MVEVLAPRAGETFIDATAGLGGHASAIAAAVSPGGEPLRVVLNDTDPGNLIHAEGVVRVASPTATIRTLRGNFADLPRRIAELLIPGDMLLADLGFSSNQIESAERGFSFQREGPLDMRLDPASPTSAADVIASSTEAELTRILREYGEEPAAPRIARKLVETRRSAPIVTTRHLADIVRSVTGPKRGSTGGGSGQIDPATKTFQALRIAVNDELGSLDALLSGLDRPRGWLNPGARVAIISFHSLEDRLVKRAFAALVASGRAEPVGRGVIEASPAELAANPRSRSAKLRAIRLH